MTKSEKEIFKAVDAANRAASNRQSIAAVLVVVALGAVAIVGLALYMYAEANW